MNRSRPTVKIPATVVGVEMIVKALRGKGIPDACEPFEDARPGFCRAENIKRSLDAELHFWTKDERRRMNFGQWVRRLHIPGDVASQIRGMVPLQKTLKGWPLIADAK